MTPAPEVVLDRLTKRYGTATVVDRLSLRMGRGSIVCLLGPNGAGKTTTLQILMGLRNPTSGDASIRGTSVRACGIHELRKTVGYLPENAALYEHLTGREFLQFVGELRGRHGAWNERLEKGLHDLELSTQADAPISTYSMGTRKKVAFLAAILHDPEILILDEPTGSLDVASARTVKGIMRGVRDRGRLVLFTTHVIELAERLADRLAVIAGGSLRFDGSLADLRRRMSAGPSETLEDLFLRLTATDAQ